MVEETEDQGSRCPSQCFSARLGWPYLVPHLWTGGRWASQVVPILQSDKVTCVHSGTNLMGTGVLDYLYSSCPPPGQLHLVLWPC